MNLFESIILGVLQGVTEFFPISSSGHLLIARKIFNINQLDLFLEVFLHTGTLVSILFYWRKEISIEIKKILNKNYEYFFQIILATIPAGLVGFLFKDEIENLFFNIQSIEYLIINYFIMGIILYIIKKNSKKENNLSIKIALLIGIAQAIAILPGMSRSGLTICAAILLGLNLKKATQFSFIMAIPILFFASIESIYSNHTIFLEKTDLLLPLLCGFISSATIGYFIINILVKIIDSNKFWFFSIYCFCISLFLLVYNYVI